MKKLIALVVVLGVLGAGGYWYYKYGTPEVKPQVTEVAVSRASIIEQVQATGTLDAERSVDIGTQVSGVVKKLYVDYNDIVKAGKLLAELDPLLLETQVSMQEANLTRSNVDLAQKKVTLENDQKKYTRTKELSAKNLVTTEQLEAAEMQVKLDQAAIDSSEASLSQTKSSLDQAKLNVSYTKIYAPIDGVITVRNTDEGRTVNASTASPTLYTMATDLTVMKLTASIDEAEVSRVRRGQNVTFRVDSFPGATFHGSVTQVRLNAKNTQNVVTYETVIRVLNGDLRLKPGMTGTLQIEIQRVDDSLRIPAAALRFRPTAEMFELLKQPVPPEATPAAGRAGGGAGAAGGGRNGRNGATDPAATEPAAATTPAAGAAKDAAAPKAAAPQMSAGTATGGRGGNAGGGRGTGRFNLTPEQQKAFDAVSKLPQDQQRDARTKLMAQFGLTGGRGQGGGQNGRNGGGRNAGAQPQAAGTGIADRGATTIDDLLPPVQRRELPNQRVWIFTNNQLKPVNGLRTGISDGQFTELVSGDLKDGDKVVTNFIIPGAAKTGTNPQQQGNPFQQPQGGGRGGGGRGGF